MNTLASSPQTIRATLALALALIFVLTLTLSAKVFASDRIISTDAFATDLVVALGAQSQLVAIDVSSKLPSHSPTLPNIGYHRNLSAEGILSLQPSLVIGSEHMGPPPTIAAIKKANIQLVHMHSAQNTEQLLANINQVATVLGQAEVASTLHNTVTEKSKALASQALKNEHIALLLSIDPSKLRLAGQQTHGDAFIKLLGAHNSVNFENYRSVTAESLLALDPSVILVVGLDPETSVMTLLENQRVLKYTTAAKSQQVFGLNGSTIVSGLSIAALDEALRISELIHSQRSRQASISR